MVTYISQITWLALVASTSNTLHESLAPWPAVTRKKTKRFRPDNLKLPYKTPSTYAHPLSLSHMPSSVPVWRQGYSFQELVTAGLAESLLKDLDPFLDVTELLAVAQDLVLDVRHRAHRIRLQLLQHALLSFPQEAVKSLERVADCSTKALRWWLWSREEKVKTRIKIVHSHK